MLAFRWEKPVVLEETDWALDLGAGFAGCATKNRKMA